MKTLREFHNFVCRVSTAFAYVSMGAMWILALLILAEIIVRFLFKGTLGVTLQMSMWLLIVMVFTGAAWTLKEEGHVRVVVLTSRLPVRAQHWLSICAGVLGLGFFVWFSYFAWAGTASIYRIKKIGTSAVSLPYWPIWVIFSLGASTLALQFACVILENVILLKKLRGNRELTKTDALHEGRDSGL